MRIMQVTVNLRINDSIIPEKVCLLRKFPDAAGNMLSDGWR